MTETLLSVGIDIGTSTTQLILSELSIENMASVFTIPRISITNKKVIFKSDIIVDLIKVLGCGVEVNSKKSKDVSSFSIDALRWNVNEDYFGNENWYNTFLLQKESTLQKFCYLCVIL